MDAVLPVGNRVYLGGGFSYVGPYTGSGVPVDGKTGAPRARFPIIGGGDVFAVVADGSGGFYVGGSFTTVDGRPRRGLVHEMADGQVDPAWAVSVNGEVYALARSGSTIYVGGKFTTLDGQPRNGLGAVDSVSGDAASWDPSPGGGDYNGCFVSALAVSGSTVYVGGDFTTMGGQARSYLAAVDAASGAATSWNPHASNQVQALAVVGSTVYAGGSFTSVGGQTRLFLAALDASSGVATAWNPDPNDDVFALAVVGSKIYVGGYFTSIGGTQHAYLTAFDAGTGVATSWDPEPDFPVLALAASGPTIYTAGEFDTIGAHGRNSLAAFDAATGRLKAWNPSAGDDASAIAVSDSTVFAGGQFSSVGGDTRNGLAAFDTRTGVATAWNPDTAGDVSALAISGSTVYAGGDFDAIGGQERPGIAAIDASTGAVKPWSPEVGPTYAMDVSGSTLLLGGPFDSPPRSGVAAIDTTNGRLTRFNAHTRWGNIGGRVDAFAVSGSTLYVGGLFDQIGGRPRSAIAALDLKTGAALPWNPGASGGDVDVTALALSGSTLYAGGEFTSIGGRRRNDIAALNVQTGKATAWNAHAPASKLANAGVYALALSGTNVYAAGIFDSIGGESRAGLAALNSRTGAATRWNPNPQPSDDPEINALAVSGSRLYVGGFFDSIGGEHHEGFAAFAQTTSRSPSNTRFTVTHIKTHADGTITCSIKLPGRGSVDVMVTAPTAALAARRTPQRLPATSFVFGHAHAAVRRAQTVRMTISPSRHGKQLVADHKPRVALTLWVTYTPTSGRARTVHFGLRLPCDDPDHDNDCDAPS